MNKWIVEQICNTMKNKVEILQGHKNGTSLVVTLQIKLTQRKTLTNATFAYRRKITEVKRQILHNG